MSIVFPEQGNFETTYRALNPDVIAYELLTFFLENVVEYRWVSQKFADLLRSLASELPREWVNNEVEGLCASCREHNLGLLRKVLSSPSGTAFLHYVVYLLTKRINFSPTEHNVYQGLGKLVGFNVKLATPELGPVAFVNDPMAQYLYIYENKASSQIFGLYPKKTALGTVWSNAPKAILALPAASEVQPGLDLRCDNCNTQLGEITLAPCKCLLCKRCIAADRNATCARCGCNKLEICQNLRSSSSYFAANEKIEIQKAAPAVQPIRDEDEEMNLVRVISYYEEIQGQIQAAREYVELLSQRRAAGQFIGNDRITLLSLQAHPTTVADLSNGLTQARIGTSISLNRR